MGFGMAGAARRAGAIVKVRLEGRSDHLRTSEPEPEPQNQNLRTRNQHMRTRQMKRETEKTKPRSNEAPGLGSSQVRAWHGSRVVFTWSNIRIFPTSCNPSASG